MVSERIKEVPYDEFVDPWAGLTIEEMKAQDSFSEGKIEKADKTRDGYDIAYNHGTCLWLSKEKLKGFKPEVGQSIRVYPGGMGSYHGVDINGKEIFWRTPLERDAKRAKWLAQHDRDQREEFARDRPKLDADFQSLSLPLQKRIQRFRDADKGFRITDEAYELFTCVEADKLYKKALSEKTIEDNEEVRRFWADEKLRKAAAYPSELKETVWGEIPENFEEKWLLWVWALNTKAYDYDYERQKKTLGTSDDHSGNTFGGAMITALRLLKGFEV